MAIKLKKLDEIATIIKIKYGNNLYRMNFIFCFKKDPQSYFIFQEFQGMPIKRIVYHKSNNSVTFLASWSSWTNPFAMVADANFENIENWKDLQDRSRPYNSYIEGGGFNKGLWRSVDRRNKTEKKKRHKKKTDTFTEFRIDRIERANFNSWGFEIYSPTISMIAFNSKYNFPYHVEDIESTDGEQSDFIDDTEPISEFDVSTIPQTRISWQGGRFNIPSFNNDEEEVSVISQSNSMTPGLIESVWGGSGADLSEGLSSYWCAKELDEENHKFDEEMREILERKNYEDDEKPVLEVGQKKIDLYFGE